MPADFCIICFWETEVAAVCHRQFGYGRGCRMCVVEFLNSYCVYGWDVNYNVQDTPRSTNCSHWALVYRKEIGC